jgi:two-component system NtrC family sensor kinase
VAGDDDDALQRIIGSLEELGGSMPELVAKLRAAAALRGEPVPAALPADAGGARFTALAAYLRRFGEPDRSAPAPRSLRDIVEDVLSMLQPELERKARVVTDFGDAPPVLATERQLGHVILSLLINAAQAMKGKPEEQRIEVRVSSDARGWAVVEVVDSGPGMPDELLARIFDPFFSTKRGAGKGLGLPVSRAIVTELGGELRAYSTVGKGSRFRIELPPAPEPKR